jgi:hypothetical protein
MAAMNRYLFHTENGELSLPVEGLSIARCVVDHAFSLETFRDRDVVTLRIEGPFTVTENGRQHALDPTEPANLGPAIALVRAVVRRARASAEGRLVVVFDDGREVTVEPNEDFEAWELIGPKGAKAVCSAGGGVSTWGTP